MSGEELAHTIRANRPGLPLIMLSGYPDLPPSARESVDTFVLKGAGGPSDLLNAISDLLATPRPAKPLAPKQTRAMLERSEQLVKRARELKERTEKAS
jgi:FixJ family two-component response regulator